MIDYFTCILISLQNPGVHVQTICTVPASLFDCILYSYQECFIEEEFYA